jgi:hypothetical protein
MHHPETGEQDKLSVTRTLSPKTCAVGKPPVSTTPGPSASGVYRIRAALTVSDPAAIEHEPCFGGDLCRQPESYPDGRDRISFVFLLTAAMANAGTITAFRGDVYPYMISAIAIGAMGNTSIAGWRNWATRQLSRVAGTPRYPRCVDWRRLVLSAGWSLPFAEAGPVVPSPPGTLRQWLHIKSRWAIVRDVMQLVARDGTRLH